MRKKWFSIQAFDGGRVAVDVRGYIGEFGLTDRQFIADLNAATAGAPPREVAVSINSRGGEVDHAIAIFNALRALKQSGTRVLARVDGIAASAASIIAMAGDEIVMPANALMMVHAPWTFAAGNADQLRREADVLDRFESALIETYAARTGKSIEQLKALLAEDTWMTAQEAVDHGFADRVEPLSDGQSIRASMTMALAEACAVPPDVLLRVMARSDAITRPEATLHQPAQPEPPAPPAATPRAAGQQALAEAVRTLCEAARMPSLAQALMPFAQTEGLEAARLALEQARAAVAGAVAVNNAIPSSSSDEHSASSTSAETILARLALRAINPRARA